VPVTTDGQEHVPSSIGPMARDLATIELSMRSIIDLEPWKSDARCTPIPWREDIYQKTLEQPLTIGILYDDKVIRPHPPLIRVLKQTVEALRLAGHDIVEWNADLHAECIEVMVSLQRVQPLSGAVC
jgi:amidase